MRGGGDHPIYCGDGCRSLHQLLTSAGLERYYELRGVVGRPAAAQPVRDRDRAWLERLARRVASAQVMRHVALEIRGLHSRGCVWLVEELFRRERGRLQLSVHPELARIELWVARDFQLDRFVSAVERFGYQLGPADAPDAPGTPRGPRVDGLARRFALCAALAGGSLLLAQALGDGDVRQIAAAAGIAFAGLALWASAPFLLWPAVHDLRRGVVTRELPIGLGLVCAFGGASFRAAASGPRGASAVAVLIALCLGTRELQDWILGRQRRALDAEGAAGILCRRIRGGQVDQVSCERVGRGDEILVAPGELVPVDAVLPAGSSDAELMETDHAGAGGGARRFAPGDRVPAGASNAGVWAVRMTAAQPFSLAALFPRISAAGRTTAMRSEARQALALIAAAAAGAAVWALAGHSARALEVAAAVLMGAPPVALALGLARQQIEARLRREGMLIRRADFLERAAAVRRVALDPIATVLATGGELRFPEGIERLNHEERAALYHLAVHNPHPRCRAVRRALEQAGRFTMLDGVRVREEPQGGVEADIAGSRYRLGAPRWVVEHGAAPAAGLGFSRDGRLLVWLIANEELRTGAAAEVDVLVEGGVEAWLLSSAEPARVRSVAAALGIAPQRACGSMQPGDKSAWLADRDHADTMFLGDGVNDGAAGAGALVCGTPNAGRPLSAAPSDFFLVAPGVAPVASALAGARQLRATTGQVQIAAGVCGGAAALLALAGLASPLLVAAAMPLAGLAMAGAAVLAVSPPPTRPPRISHVAHMELGVSGRPGAVAPAHS